MVQFQSMAQSASPGNTMIRLTAGENVVLVDVVAGGRVAQILIREQPLLEGDAEPGECQDPTSINWGLFAMAPWAGRVGGGRFKFEGLHHQLELNHCDPGQNSSNDNNHAIHGTVFARPWTVDSLTEYSLEMSCALDGALAWPFDGIAKQRIELSADSVTFELGVESSSLPFPAEIGWHPWFRKPQRLSFEPTAMFERNNLGLPTGAIIEPTNGPWDDCFLNSEPVVLHYDRSIARTIRVESDCDHWVVFDEMAGSTCVEPQSGPPDAFRLNPHVVTSSHPLRRHMSIYW